MVLVGGLYSLYLDCLYDAATNSDAHLFLSGTSTKLEKILETKSEKSHISIK